MALMKSRVIRRSALVSMVAIGIVIGLSPAEQAPQAQAPGAATARGQQAAQPDTAAQDATAERLRAETYARCDAVIKVAAEVYPEPEKGHLQGISRSFTAEARKALELGSLDEDRFAQLQRVGDTEIRRSLFRANWQLARRQVDNCIFALAGTPQSEVARKVIPENQPR